MTRTLLNQHQPSSLTRLGHAAIAFMVALLIAGCSSTKVEVDPTIGWSAERLYQDAREEISAGNWKDARTRLEAIEARYPFGG